MENKCPMTNKAVKEYGLTGKAVARFCNLGCSVECAAKFEAYVKKKKKTEIDHIETV